MISATRSSRDPHRMLLIAAALIYACTLCAIVVVRAESSTDFRDFWRTGREFLETGAIRSDLGVHNYLPVFTILLAPLSLLPLPAAIVVFTLTSLAAFAATVRMVESELRGASRTAAAPAGPASTSPPRPAVLAAVGLMLPYVTSCAVLGSFSLVLLFLCVSAWRLAARRRTWLAGAVLGFAALLKLLPAALIGYFLLRGQWRVAGGAALVVVVLGLGLPLALLGPAETRAQHAAFYERAVQGHSARATIFAEQPLKANYSNSALPMVLKRLLSPVNAGKESAGPPELRVHAAQWPPGRIWALYVGLMAAFGGLTVLATLCAGHAARAARPPADRFHPADAAHPAERWAFGAWCCLMLIASPLVWTHYIPLAYYPLALLADYGQRRGDLRRPSVPAAAVMLCWLAAAVLLAWPAARAAGVTLAGVVLLWAAMVGWALRAARTPPGPGNLPAAPAQ